ncbi:GNAT family N-acetyltransferase [Vibrio kyushuensis]|uniref:GNAT family N-acetyltransferase n=1 Tax=Vibrio kyushuensis TaxID=2910249 RepID=UPI003D0B5D42
MLLESHQIKLRSLEVTDTEEFHTWASDREVTQFSLSSYAYPQSKSDISKWLSSINDSPKTVSFGICCTQTNMLIGYAGIASISQLNRSGEYFILIGDREYWRKGVGTEVTKLITNYDINCLGLHRIELTAFASNPSAIKTYEKSGYQHEGIKRQSGFRNGTFVDKVQMSVLAHEWSGI